MHGYDDESWLPYLRKLWFSNIIFDLFFYGGKRDITSHFFLFFWFSVNVFKKILSISFKESISEARFVMIFEFAEIIHVELCGLSLYLPYEAFVFAVPEVSG